jgi:phosphoribosylaminoimidazolecarboxamide formyltransferase/IMP cyclohydrolase
MPDLVRVRRALVSVSDKRGLVDLARALVRHGVELLSTGGTAKELAAAGLAVTAIADYTGAPEILGGRVKTLHPRIHGGLLGRPTPEHEAEMAAHDIAPIDLVVVNLYRFRETVARPGVTVEEAVENIDIGGPSMLRSGAKNHERVAVLVDPDDYAALVAELDGNDGQTHAATRFRLARRVYAHTAAYDGAIAAYLSSLGEDGARAHFPEVMTWQGRRVRALRYGENPHQQAAFYADDASGLSLARAAVLQGKELSYNNLLDLDAALVAVLEHAGPAAVIVKHGNPCGVASDAGGVTGAYLKARETDPISAFGGIVAVNREVDLTLARALSEAFLECVIAPSFAADALALLAAKKNLRLLATGALPATPEGGDTLRSVVGGFLVQSRDTGMVDARAAQVVSKRAPSSDELTALDFAWRVAKHVKSNAIVLANAGQTVGIGAGQMSRVDSVKLAVGKAVLTVRGSVAASDAFFPFRDGVDALAEAGVTAVVQPGGSVKDAEVIACADERGLAMLFTSMRHFRH